MIRNTILLLCVAGCIYTSAAQQLRRFSIKTNVEAAFNHRVSLAAEWYWKPNKGWEIQADYEQLQRLENYHAVWTTEYAEQQKSFRYLYSETFKPRLLPKEFVGTGRPLPAVAKYIGLSNLQLSVGHRFYFQPDQKKWRVVLQPSLSATRHAYLYTFDQIEVTEEQQKQHVEDVLLFDRNTTFYRQTRTTDYHEAWISSCTNEIGIMRLFKGGFNLEARFLQGVTFGRTPVPELDGIKRFRKFYGAARLMLGISFG